MITSHYDPGIGYWTTDHWVVGSPPVSDLHIGTPVITQQLCPDLV